MKYQVFIRKSAERALRKLDKKYQKYVVQKVMELAENPRGHKCEKLAGAEGGYRKVAWPYRILYAINDDTQEVDVYLIAHRKEVYR